MLAAWAILVVIALLVRLRANIEIGGDSPGRLLVAESMV